MSFSLSIVIPAYNEEKRIGASLRQIFDYLEKRKLSAEVIVVDDGSTDRTREAVQAFQEVRFFANAKNRGKGAVVRQGMMEARGELVLFTDADLSTPIEDLEKLQSALDAGADIAIGSRALKESKIGVHQPKSREAVGKLFNFLVRVFFLPKIQDSQCGFKLFRAEAANKIMPKQKINNMVFDVEILYLARKFGLGITEVPIHWNNSPETKFHFSWKNAIEVLTGLFAIYKEHGLIRL